MQNYTHLPLYYDGACLHNEEYTGGIHLKLGNIIINKHINDIKYTALYELVKDYRSCIHVITTDKIPELGDYDINTDSVYEYIITWTKIKQLLPKSDIEYAIKAHCDKMHSMH